MVYIENWDDFQERSIVLFRSDPVAVCALIFLCNQESLYDLLPFLPFMSFEVLGLHVMEAFERGVGTILLRLESEEGRNCRNFFWLAVMHRG